MQNTDRNGRQVEVGAGCVVRDHVRVCGGAVLGMGCVVVKDVLEAGGIEIELKGKWKYDEGQNSYCLKHVEICKPLVKHKEKTNSFCF